MPGLNSLRDRALAAMTRTLHNCNEAVRGLSEVDFYRCKRDAAVHTGTPGLRKPIDRQEFT